MVIEKTGELVINKFYYEHELKRSEKELEIRKRLHGQELSDRIRHYGRRELTASVFILVLSRLILYLLFFL